jgi:hypothetical protein
MIRYLLIDFHAVNGDMFLRNVHNTAHFKMVPAPKIRINKYNECDEQKWEIERMGTGHSNQGRQRTTGYWILSETPTSDPSIWALEPLGPLRWSEVVLTVITNSAWVFVIYLSHQGNEEVEVQLHAFFFSMLYNNAVNCWDYVASVTNEWVWSICEIILEG